MQYYYDKFNADYNSYYSQGSLLQSNIKAVSGTYPDNGRHTDTYWYVKGVATNEYYYNKYVANNTPTYSNQGSFNFTDTGVMAMDSISVASSYGWSSSDGFYPINTGNPFPHTVTQEGYVGSGASMLKYYCLSLDGDYNVFTATCTATNHYSQGALVQSNIEALNGTYPLNGIHTDGYWYVRGSLTNKYYFNKYNSDFNEYYSKGDYIETLTAENGTYPINAKQGGYWYVRGGILVIGNSFFGKL